MVVREMSTGEKTTISSRRSCKRNNRLSLLAFTHGFTAIELIIVIVFLGILAGTVLMRSTFTIQDYGNIAADQLIADIQYVQMKAMGLGSRQKILFSNGSGKYCLCNAPGCLYSTCSTTGEVKTLPGDILINSTNFGTSLEFNTLGEPTYGTGNGTVNLSSGRVITVYGITGKAE